MNIHKIILLFSLIISPLALAHPTFDLLTAIEKGDVEGVKSALAQGANPDSIRSIDNHSARTLAHSKILEFFGESKNTMYASSFAALSLPAMAFYENPKYAFLSSLALAWGVLIPYKAHNQGASLSTQSANVAGALGLGGVLGICATAWTAPEKWQMIVNAIGAIGLTTLIYKSLQFNKYVCINSLLNPQDYQLTPENIQS